jgi:hypothetical protein
MRMLMHPRSPLSRTRLGPVMAACGTGGGTGPSTVALCAAGDAATPPAAMSPAATITESPATGPDDSYDQNHQISLINGLCCNNCMVLWIWILEQKLMHFNTSRLEQ